MSKVAQWIGAGLLAAFLAYGSSLVVMDFVRDQSIYHALLAVASPIGSFLVCMLVISFFFKPMGYFRPPELEVGESMIWERWANHTQGWRAVGGKLHLTTNRLIFKANKLDAMLGGRDWSARRDAIAETGIAGRDFGDGPFSGGLRRRLQVELSDGSKELFVVNRVGEVASKLQSRLA